MAAHEYEVLADMAGGQAPIWWTTDHAQTAHRWYREMLASGAPCDGGCGKVVRVSIYRDDRRLKSEAVRVEAA
jgi:hypothetical protein